MSAYSSGEEERPEQQKGNGSDVCHTEDREREREGGLVHLLNTHQPHHHTQSVCDRSMATGVLCINYNEKIRENNKRREGKELLKKGVLL